MTMPPWSFSSLNDYANCPRAYQLKRVTKEVTQVETEQMKYGTECHLFLENRVAKGDALPEHLAWVEPYIVQMEKSGGKLIAEQKLGLTKGLTPTGFFSPDVWVRGVVDLTVRYGVKSVVIDHKTGKRKMDSDQLMLFAAFEFADRPYVPEVRTGYLWLKDKKLDTEVFRREDLPRIWGHFIPKVEKLEQAYEKDEWPCRPSGLCPWCPASRAQCKHKR